MSWSHPGGSSLARMITVKIVGRANQIIRILFPDLPSTKMRAPIAMNRYVMDLIIDDFHRRTEDIVRAAGDSTVCNPVANGL